MYYQQTNITKPSPPSPPRPPVVPAPPPPPPHPIPPFPPAPPVPEAFAPPPAPGSEKKVGSNKVIPSSPAAPIAAPPDKSLLHIEFVDVVGPKTLPPAPATPEVTPPPPAPPAGLPENVAFVPATNVPANPANAAGRE